MKIQTHYKSGFLVTVCFLMVIHSAAGSELRSSQQRDTVLQNTLIIPASDFLYELPKGNIITDAGSLGVPWLFNNTGIVLKSLSNMMTRINVSEAGQYYLFVRSHGKKE